MLAISIIVFTPQILIQNIYVKEEFFQIEFPSGVFVRVEPTPLNIASNQLSISGLFSTRSSVDQVGKTSCEPVCQYAWLDYNVDWQKLTNSSQQSLQSQQSCFTRSYYMSAEETRDGGAEEVRKVRKIFTICHQIRHKCVKLGAGPHFEAE